MRTRRRGLTILVAVVVLAIPATVYAAGGAFTDDETSVFEEDINWLAETDVTRGCNPPDNTRFCPDDNVTRGQMAAFMHRFDDYLGRPGVARQVLEFSTTSTTAVELTPFSVDVPGPGTLILEIGGQYWLDLDAADETETFGVVQLGICDAPDSLTEEDCGDSFTDARYADYDNGVALNATPGISTSRIVQVDEAGTLSFSINGLTDTGAEFHDWYTYLQVTFLPGENSLDGALVFG